MPFFDLYDRVVPFEVAINGYRPPRPGPEVETRGLTDNIWILMESCWNHDPRLRPKTIEANLDLEEFTLCSATKLGVLPPLVSSKSAKVTTCFADTRRINVMEVVASISKKCKTRGWFDNVWDVQLIERPEFNSRKILNNYPNGSCRVMNMPVLEGCYVSTSPFIYEADLTIHTIISLRSKLLRSCQTYREEATVDC